MIIMNEGKNKLKKIVRRFPNDMDLGNHFRNNYLGIVDVNIFQADKLVHQFPNDKDLGSYLRSSPESLMVEYM